jgi:hypothetical protein
MSGSNQENSHIAQESGNGVDRGPSRTTWPPAWLKTGDHAATNEPTESPQVEAGKAEPPPQPTADDPTDAQLVLWLRILRSRGVSFGLTNNELFAKFPEPMRTPARLADWNQQRHRIVVLLRDRLI